MGAFLIVPAYLTVAWGWALPLIWALWLAGRAMVVRWITDEWPPPLLKRVAILGVLAFLWQQGTSAFNLGQNLGTVTSADGTSQAMMVRSGAMTYSMSLPGEGPQASHIDLSRRPAEVFWMRGNDAIGVLYHDDFRKIFDLDLHRKLETSILHPTEEQLRRYRGSDFTPNEFMEHERERRLAANEKRLWQDRPGWMASGTRVLVAWGWLVVLAGAGIMAVERHRRESWDRVTIASIVGLALMGSAWYCATTSWRGTELLGSLKADDRNAVAALDRTAAEYWLKLETDQGTRNLKLRSLPERMFWVDGGNLIGLYYSNSDRNEMVDVDLAIRVENNPNAMLTPDEVRRTYRGWMLRSNEARKQFSAAASEAIQFGTGWPPDLPDLQN